MIAEGMRLNSRYSENDIVTSDIGEDELLEDEYTTMPYVSITFRFDNSPF